MKNLSPAFIAHMEWMRFECVAKYVSLGWELADARSASERTYSTRFVRSLFPRL